MKFKSVVMAMSALSLATAPTVASAATVTAPQPAAQQVSGDNAFFGGQGAIVGILALLAIVGGIIAATSHTNTRPNSP